MWLFAILLLNLAGSQANATLSFTALVLSPVLASVSAQPWCSSAFYLSWFPWRWVYFLLSTYLLDKTSHILPCVFWSNTSPPGSVLFSSHLCYSHFRSKMCHLFLRLNRSLGEREGERVRACMSADTLQLQGKPGWNRKPEAPGQAAVRPAPWLLSHLCLTLEVSWQEWERLVSSPWALTHSLT